MPYYNYYPATYQPFNQNYYNQQFQQSQPQVQTNGIIWVSNDAEADSYPLAPNNAITLWHRSMPIVYFKQADASGKPTMKIYDLVEHKPTTPDTQEFATKDEIRSLEDIVQDLKNRVDGLRKDLGDE
jgi:hypothetical protein